MTLVCHGDRNRWRPTQIHLVDLCCCCCCCCFCRCFCCWCFSECSSGDCSFPATQCFCSLRAVLVLPMLKGRPPMNDSSKQWPSYKWLYDVIWLVHWSMGWWWLMDHLTGFLIVRSIEWSTMATMTAWKRICLIDPCLGRFVSFMLLDCLLGWMLHLIILWLIGRSIG